mgnify:CR=1 FL=1
MFATEPYINEYNSNFTYEPLADCSSNFLLCFF